MHDYYRDTVIEINLDQIKKNLNEIKAKASPNKFLYAVAKADAYGHGLKQISQTIIDSNVDGIALATLGEAIIARELDKDVKILCLGSIPLRHLEIASENDITITVFNMDYIKQLSNIKLEHDLKVQIKVNTGMNRIGLVSSEEILEAIKLLEKNDHLIIDGIYTHLSTSEGYDEISLNYLDMQYNKFKEIVKKVNYPFNQIHCTNSSALLRKYDNDDFTNAHRVGSALYGILQDIIQDEYDIKAAYTLKSKIHHVTTYPKDSYIGYDLAYQTQKDNEIIATIPIGYGDGLSRTFSGLKVRCKEQYGTIVGNICMDQIMVTFENPIEVDDEVYFIDPNDENICIYQRSDELNKITNEILTGFSIRIPKLFYKDNQLVDIDSNIMKK